MSHPTPSIRSFLLPLAGLLTVAVPGRAQTPERPRPRPYPVFETPQFARAVEQGTRTRTGVPGPSYWQQYARYTLAGALDPATSQFTGEGTVRYYNRSPDSLRFLFLHVRHNLFREDALKNTTVPVTGGVTFSRVSAAGQDLTELENNRRTAGYRVNGTIMRVNLPAPLVPGDSIDLGFAWSMTLPPNGAPRQGNDGEVIYVAYWYPQMAVYDDVAGWNIDPYLGNGEFYMGYADYDVSLTVPAGWLVASTGTLANPEEVLSPTVRQRLAEARRGREVVHVVTEADRAPGRSTTAGKDGKLTWRFQAQNVRDVDWGTSDKYLWDATVAVTGGMTGGRPDTSNIYTFYRPSAQVWTNSARYARHSIEFLSHFLWPYPYAHMTSVDGPASCGGMEYPMMTCIGGFRDTTSLYGVIVHELAHMWFPMQVGSDETAHAWMDEGLTEYNEYQGEKDFFGQGGETQNRGFLLQVLGSGVDITLMRHGDHYDSGLAYGIASYFKMAANLRSLRAILGDSLFFQGYRGYGRAWAGKHPTEFDFFDAFNTAAGRDLWWFWRTWFYESWPLDQAVGSVTTVGDSVEITVRDEGLAPMPVFLRVTYAGGTTRDLRLPVDPWLAGARTQTTTVPKEDGVTVVAIDPELWFPDVKPANNTWRPAAGAGGATTPP